MDSASALLGLDSVELLDLDSEPALLGLDSAPALLDLDSPSALLDLESENNLAAASYAPSTILSASSIGCVWIICISSTNTSVVDVGFVISSIIPFTKSYTILSSNFTIKSLSVSTNIL